MVGRKAQKPLRAGVPPIYFGNMPMDGGNLLLTEEEKAELLEAERAAHPLVQGVAAD